MGGGGVSYSILQPINTLSKKFISSYRNNKNHFSNKKFIPAREA